MPAACLPAPDDLLRSCPPRRGLRVGLDSIAIAEVEQAWRAFGQRYLRRLFTDEEADYALASPVHTGERLAVRFAAKEAVIKALNLGEAGVSLRDIGVRRAADGTPSLELQGLAQAAWTALGASDLALSLSHDDTHACAVVVILPRDVPN